MALPVDGFGGRFAVANDEDNLLRVYDAGRVGGAPRATLDLDDHLGTPADDRGRGKGKADIEAATWLGDRVYWIASHSRNGDGERRRSRHQFFATTVAAEGDGVTLRPVGRTLSLLDELRRVLDEDGLDLGWTVGRGEDDKRLVPERRGLNVEGLAARPDGRSLLIGLRNPLAGGRAVVVPFLNPREAVDGAAPPRLGKPIALDLGGRGIRSMEHSEARRGYMILAGPTADGVEMPNPAFDLYLWSGQPGGGATRVAGFAEALADPATLRTSTLAGRSNLHPEAMLVNREGSAVWLFSDDGDLQVNGTPCSELPEDQRQFRSMVLPLQ
ncbi:DUF3616 domain-containing protein [Dankookia sp. GCM10030260]